MSCFFADTHRIWGYSLPLPPQTHHPIFLNLSAKFVSLFDRILITSQSVQSMCLIVEKKKFSYCVTKALYYTFEYNI